MKTFWAHPTRRRPQADPQSAGGIVPSGFVGLGIPQEELEDLAGEIKVWTPKSFNGV